MVGREGCRHTNLYYGLFRNLPNRSKDTEKENVSRMNGLLLCLMNLTLAMISSILHANKSDCWSSSRL
ncbi:hypothetical protein GQX74_010704 [Glossina fuscipes]|nr:hypothetical protein GQX74_010704 [Glossina fuscipes]